MKNTNSIFTIAAAGTPIRPVASSIMCRNVLIQAPSTNAAKKLLIKDYPTGNVIAEVPAGGSYVEESQNDCNDVDAGSYFVDTDTNGAQFYFTYTTN